MLDTAIDTIVMRPYVFSFFVAYLLACVPHVGWYKTLIFTVIGYAIAFSSEKTLHYHRISIRLVLLH